MEFDVDARIQAEEIDDNIDDDDNATLPVTSSPPYQKCDYNSVML